MSVNKETINLRRPVVEGNNRDDRYGRLLAQRGYVGVAKGTTKVRFAACGDVHGQFALLSRKLHDLREELPSLDFILQVGDIECHRNEEDLRSMAAPSKKRTLGDFGSACHLQQDYLPHPMFFIGGNHECYGWLDSEDHFTTTTNGNADETRQSQAFLEVAPNVFYLGRAGYLPLRFFEKEPPQQEGDSSKPQGHPNELNILGVLHLGFLSGIHRPTEYFYRRPAMTSDNLDTESNRRWIGFNVYDTQLLLEDERDDGIAHINHNHELLGSGSSNDGLPAGYECQRPGRQALTFLLARLLGVELTLPQLQDESFDILLSQADVQFLSRLLIPRLSSDESGEATAKKRHDAVDVLPRGLVGIVSALLEGRSKVGVEKLCNRLQRKRAVDVFLTHDWPGGVVEEKELYRTSTTSRPAGNIICRELLDSLKPQVHCCGHMHTGYRQRIKHKTPNGKPSQRVTELCCLGKVGFSGSAAFAIFELDLETGEIVEVDRDPRLLKLGSIGDTDDDD